MREPKDVKIDFRINSTLLAVFDDTVGKGQRSKVIVRLIKEYLRKEDKKLEENVSDE